MKGWKLFWGGVALPRLDVGMCRGGWDIGEMLLMTICSFWCCRGSCISGIVCGLPVGFSQNFSEYRVSE